MNNSRSNRSAYVWAARCFFLGFGAMVIAVSAYFDLVTDALGDDLAKGHGTVVRLYQITRSGGGVRHDYRAEVRLASDLDLTTMVDLSEEQFGQLSEGDRLALAWERGRPSNIMSGPLVERLVSGEIDAEEFVAAQKQVARFAMAAGIVCLVVGAAFLVFVRAPPVST